MRSTFQLIWLSSTSSLDGHPLLHRLSRVRCPQPWPRPTTARSRRRCGAAETASAALSAPSHPAPATPGSRLLHKPARRSLRLAVCRAPRESLPTASLLVAASASGQHGSAAHSTARSSAVAARSPERTSPTACPPSCTAHPVAHTSSRETYPTNVALLRTPPAARDRGGADPARTCGRPDRSSQLHRRGLSMQWSTHCAVHPLASSPTTLLLSAVGTCRPLKPSRFHRTARCCFRLPGPGLLTGSPARARTPPRHSLHWMMMLAWPLQVRTSLVCG